MCGGDPIGDLTSNTFGSINKIASDTANTARDAWGNTTGSVRDVAMSILMPLFGKPPAPTGGTAPTNLRGQSGGVAQSYADALASSTSGMSASVGQGMLNSPGSGKGTLGRVYEAR